jgi:hypothetical protein
LSRVLHPPSRTLRLRPLGQPINRTKRSSPATGAPGFPRADPTVSLDAVKDVVDEAMLVGGNAFAASEPIQLRYGALRLKQQNAGNLLTRHGDGAPALLQFLDRLVQIECGRVRDLATFPGFLKLTLVAPSGEVLRFRRPVKECPVPGGEALRILREAHRRQNHIKAGDVSFLSHPREVAKVIEEASRATLQ